jgi:hypothetical protein
MKGIEQSIQMLYVLSLKVQSTHFNCNHKNKKIGIFYFNGRSRAYIDKRVYNSRSAIKLDLSLHENLPFVCLLQLFKQKACIFSKFQINVLALISIALFTPVIS